MTRVQWYRERERGHRAWLRVFVCAVVASAALFGGASSAFAAALLSVGPDIPAPTAPPLLVVGTTVPSQLVVNNDSTTAGNPITLNTIAMVPSCSDPSTITLGGDCGAGAADPGVFTPSATGTGEAGTACAGDTFTITAETTPAGAAEGRYDFTTVAPVVLGDPTVAGSLSSCVIDFTTKVNKDPAPDADPAAPGIQTIEIGFAKGTTPAALSPQATGINEVTLTTPTIAVTKVASPTSQAAPGGTFTFTAQVSNPNPVDPIKITSLVDNVYGNLATLAGSTCGALINTTLAPSTTSAPCTFTGPFNGVAGASQTDTITVVGVDASGTTATATANATVTLTAPPQIAVTKVANPTTEVEPGGSFGFTLRVSNPSPTTSVTITKLVDNIYGDVTIIPGNTCLALIGVVLAPGATSQTCTFAGTFTGKAGNSQTDTVTATGVNGPTTVTATAMATVSLTPAAPLIGVTKTAAPASAVEPGGTFTFTVQVSNPSTLEPVTITGLVDNVYGDVTKIAGNTCAPLIGTVLAPGAKSAACTFPGAFTGKAGASDTDTVTATGTNNGTTVTATASATVTLTPAGSQIAVSKVASPKTLVAPGGTFTFTVAVSNPSTFEPITITSLADSIYGNLATRPGSTCGALIGVTLAPGATSAPCSFTGTFDGTGGASETDVVTVTGAGPGGSATATATATVGLTPAPVVKPGAVVSSSTLTRPSGCVGAASVKVYVTGSNIKSVSYSLDGRHLATITKRDSQHRYLVTVKTAGLSLRTHHLVAAVKYTNGTSRTLHGNIQRCQPARTPLFTG